MTMHCAEAIRARVAAANNNDALACRYNFLRRIEQVALTTLVGLRQELHRKVDALQFPSWNVQVARRFGATGKQDCVKLALQIVNWNGVSDVRVGHEFHALGLHLLETPIEDALLHLELGNTVAQQPANAISLFVNCDPMPSAIQLLGCCKPCRA